MQGADYDVKRHPGNQQPARPVAAIEHEYAGYDGSNPDEMDHPMVL